MTRSVASELDPRLNAVRPDLADERLRGLVEASSFVTGKPARVASPVLDLHRRPDPSSGIDTQLLCGDEVLVFDESEGWAWLQSVADGYVGYASAAAVTDAAPEPTHVVTAQRSFLHPAADMKLPPTCCHSMGAGLAIVGFAETRGTSYGLLASGEAIIAGHIAPLGAVVSDFVEVAERLLRTPYLWGGASAFGIDCSGLIQLAMRMSGSKVLRDTDMQAASIGSAIDPGPRLAGLRRGDLVFWKGHVAIMTDGETIVHANGHTMDVAIEALAEAVDRIAHLYGRPTGFRRP